MRIVNVQTKGRSTPPRMARTTVTRSTFKRPAVIGTPITLRTASSSATLASVAVRRLILQPLQRAIGQESRSARVAQDWIDLRLRKRSSRSSLMSEAQGLGCPPVRFVRENREVERGASRGAAKEEAWGVCGAAARCLCHARRLRREQLCGPSLLRPRRRMPSSRISLAGPAPAIRARSSILGSDTKKESVFR